MDEFQKIALRAPDSFYEPLRIVAILLAQAFEMRWVQGIMPTDLPPPRDLQEEVIQRAMKFQRIKSIMDINSQNVEDAFAKSFDFAFVKRTSIFTHRASRVRSSSTWRQSTSQRTST